MAANEWTISKTRWEMNEHDCEYKELHLPSCATHETIKIFQEHYSPLSYLQLSVQLSCTGDRDHVGGGISKFFIGARHYEGHNGDILFKPYGNSIRSGELSATWTQTEICPKSFSIELQARALLKPVLRTVRSSITPTHKQRAPAVKPASQDKGLTAPYLRSDTGFCLE